MTKLDDERALVPTGREDLMYFAGAKHFHVAIQGAARALCYVKVQGPVTSIPPNRAHGCPRCEAKAIERYKKGVDLVARACERVYRLYPEVDQAILPAAINTARARIGFTPEKDFPGAGYLSDAD